MAAKTVRLATDLTALAEPTFLIQDGNKIYVTVAVLEYDPGKAKGKQEKDVARMARMFSGMPEASRVSVRKVKRGDLVAVQTDPPGVQTGPGPVGPIGPGGGRPRRPPGGGVR